MDPITTAIVTALATNLGKDAIKDGYEALKAAIKKKFGDDSDVVDAVS
jgi:predicted Ser/Thr protein kinase